MGYSQGGKYMSVFEAKKQIVEMGRRMYAKGFVAANDGNISCRTGVNEVVCTPTGVSKGFLTPNMLVTVDMNGKVLSGNMSPSSEIKMHLRVYKEKSDITAVTHAHPMAATSFAIAGIPLDKAVLPEQVVLLGSVPIAKYALTGTHEVPDSIAPYLQEYNAVLLANHGALTWGRSIEEAFFRLEEVEYFAQITLNVYTLLGRANELSCEQVDQLLEVRKKFGINTGGLPLCGGEATNMKDVVSSTDTSSPIVKLIDDGEDNTSAQTSELVKEITALVLKQLKG